MRYREWTIESRSPIKRFSHNARLERAIELLAPEPTDRILDYGAGDGTFLRRLHAREPRAALCGFEPRIGAEARQWTAEIPALEGIHDSIDTLAAFRPNKIACLEVLEHLQVEAQQVALSSFRRLVADPGLVLISVPIEIGPASVFKNVVRKAIDQPHRGITTRNVLLSLLGMTNHVARDLEAEYIASHVGFDYRNLERIIRARGFHAKRRYSPFRGLGPLFNSQLFFVLTRRR